jgi:hypothetical protein
MMMIPLLRCITATYLLLISHVLLSSESITNAWTTSRTLIPLRSPAPPAQHAPPQQGRIRERPAAVSSAYLLSKKASYTSLLHRRSAADHQQDESPASLSSSHQEEEHRSRTNEDCHEEAAFLSRRHWLLRQGSLAVMAAGITQIISPRPAVAVVATATTAPAAAVVVVTTTPATCDATVSVWRRGRRLVYLLGTAHISEVSAQLAGQLVQDAHPNAVFVELDLKRVGGLLLRNPEGGAANNNMAQEYIPKDTATTLTGEGSGGGVVVAADAAKPPRILVPTVSSSSSSLPQSTMALSTDTAASSSTNDLVPRQPQQQQQQQSGGWFQRQLLSVAAATVGRALKSMYQSLGDSGFTPGDEFRTAMTVAQQQGATIVLGDQDVDVTLRRLTQALQSTDWQKLQSPEMEQKLAALMPPATTTTAGSSSSSSSVALNSLPPARENYPSNEAFKKDLSEYVEKLKSRESVRSIMVRKHILGNCIVWFFSHPKQSHLLDSLIRRKWFLSRRRHIYTPVGMRASI